MDSTDWVEITDAQGQRLRAQLLASESPGQLVRLEDGRTVLIPEGALVQSSGGYELQWSWRELASGAQEPTLASGAGAGSEREVLQLAEEVVSVSKRVVERARVRVGKRVVTREAVVDEPLRSEEVEVERVSVNRLVEGAEAARVDGDVTIIPLYEEVLVVEKRLMLTEELHVKKRSSEKRAPQTVTLRREELEVERVALEDREL